MFETHGYDYRSVKGHLFKMLYSGYKVYFILIMNSMFKVISRNGRLTIAKSK